MRTAIGHRKQLNVPIDELDIDAVDNTRRVAELFEQLPSTVLHLGPQVELTCRSWAPAEAQVHGTTSRHGWASLCDVLASESIRFRSGRNAEVLGDIPLTEPNQRIAYMLRPWLTQHCWSAPHASEPTCPLATWPPHQVSRHRR